MASPHSQAMKWPLGLASVIWLSVAAGCSQPQSAATDHPTSAPLVEEMATTNSPVAAVAEPEKPYSEQSDSVSAPALPPAQLPTKPSPPPADRTPVRPGDAE